MPRHVNSPFHCLSDDALWLIGNLVTGWLTPVTGGTLKIELENFLVDITAELQHRRLTDSSYNMTAPTTDNSDLLG